MFENVGSERRYSREQGIVVVSNQAVTGVMFDIVADMTILRIAASALSYSPLSHRTSRGIIRLRRARHAYKITAHHRCARISLPLRAFHALALF